MADERNLLIRDISSNMWQILEMLCEKYGGRVDLAKAYFKALTSSVNKHFDGNAVIASMEHCNDFMFLGTEAISLGRVGKFSTSNCNGFMFFIIYYFHTLIYLSNLRLLLLQYVGLFL